MPDTRLYQLLLEQAPLLGDTSVMTAGATTLSYPQLLDAVEDARVRALEAVTVQSGDVLRASCDSSLHGIIGLLGALATGMDIIVQAEGKSSIVPLGVTERFFDSDDDLQRIAVFTSGTTGARKCTVHTICSLLQGVWSTIAVESILMGQKCDPPVSDDALMNELSASLGRGRDRSTFYSGMAPSTISGLSILLRSLLTGSRIVYGPSSMFSIGDVLDAVEGERITNLALSPFMAQMLLREQRRHPREVNTLRSLGLGSSAVPEGLCDELERAFRVVTSIGYGMTETAGVIAHTALAPSGATPVPGAVGVAVPGALFRVQEFDTPDGERNGIGELLVHTRSLFERYGGVSESENASSWVEHGGLRWFRTRDRARLLDDGVLVLYGRSSEVILRGGRMIDPGAVERTLQRAPGVEAAFAAGYGGRVPGEQEVVAAVQLATDGTISERELIRHCISDLPNYAVPRKILFVESLPIVADGSIDRAAAGQILSTLLASDEKG